MFIYKTHGNHWNFAAKILIADLNLSPKTLAALLSCIFILSNICIRSTRFALQIMLSITTDQDFHPGKKFIGTDEFDRRAFSNFFSNNFN